MCLFWLSHRRRICNNWEELSWLLTEENSALDLIKSDLLSSGGYFRCTPTVLCKCLMILLSYLVIIW